MFIISSPFLFFPFFVSIFLPFFLSFLFLSHSSSDSPPNRLPNRQDFINSPLLSPSHLAIIWGQVKDVPPPSPSTFLLSSPPPISPSHSSRMSFPLPMLSFPLRFFLFLLFLSFFFFFSSNWSIIWGQHMLFSFFFSFLFLSLSLSLSFSFSFLFFFFFFFLFLFFSSFFFSSPLYPPSPPFSFPPFLFFLNIFQFGSPNTSRFFPLHSRFFFFSFCQSPSPSLKMTFPFTPTTISFEVIYILFVFHIFPLLFSLFSFFPSLPHHLSSSFPSIYPHEVLQKNFLVSGVLLLPSYFCLLAPPLLWILFLCSTFFFGSEWFLLSHILSHFLSIGSK